MPEARNFGDLIFDLTHPTSHAEQIPLYEHFWQEPWHSRIYQVAKRVLDICGALCGLLVLALLLPIIALLIWREGAGPIFYKQIRVGLHGQVFLLYKLRTMIVGADTYLDQHPELAAAWRKTGKLSDDPRITRLGSFLRRTSLDELPQLWNVLRGEMSLVGPRAIQFSEVHAFRELIELRHQVKPGLTGLWQVSGRSTTSYEQRMILDCTYILECSLWMDIAILWKTLPIVLGRTGAY
ncbi:MAG: sugar transferase [Chloroflexota bacterium]|nr:sugar transferase [Chloroflexota bacterium]